MLTRAEAAVRDRIKAALDLSDLCRQFHAATDIAICCLSPSEVRTYMTDLMEIRRNTPAIDYGSCELPAGLFRPRPGERVSERHKHG
jgi:hypothetical protein